MPGSESHEALGTGKSSSMVGKKKKLEQQLSGTRGWGGGVLAGKGHRETSRGGIFQRLYFLIRV